MSSYIVSIPSMGLWGNRICARKTVWYTIHIQYLDKKQKRCYNCLLILAIRLCLERADLIIWNQCNKRQRKKEKVLSIQLPND